MSNWKSQLEQNTHNHTITVSEETEPFQPRARISFPTQKSQERYNIAGERSRNSTQERKTALQNIRNRLDLLNEKVSVVYSVSDFEPVSSATSPLKVAECAQQTQQTQTPTKSSPKPRCNKRGSIASSSPVHYDSDTQSDESGTPRTKLAKASRNLLAIPTIPCSKLLSRGQSRLSSGSHYSEAATHLSGDNFEATFDAQESIAREIEEIRLLTFIPHVEVTEVDGVNFGDFQSGLRLSLTRFQEILEHIVDSITSVGTQLKESFDEPEGKDILADITQSTLDVLRKIRRSEVELGRANEALFLTPRWFMAIWIQKLGRVISHFKKGWTLTNQLESLQEDDEPINKKKCAIAGSGSRADWSPQAKLAFNKNQKEKATLDQSELHFQIILPGRREEIESIVLLLTQAMVVTSNQADEHAKYSLEQVLHRLEQKLHRTNCLKRTDTRYGRLWWIDDTFRESKHNEIADQNEFEAAIHTLFASRGERNELHFTFMPEPDNTRSKRMESERDALRKKSRVDKYAQGFTKYIGSDSESSRPASRIQSSRSSTHYSMVKAEPPLPSPTTSTRSYKSTNPLFGRFTELKHRAKETAASLTLHEAVTDRHMRWKKLVVVSHWNTFRTGGDEEAQEVDENDLEAGKNAGDDILLVSHEFEDEKNTADDIVAKLQDLINLPELTQIMDERWLECCKVFSIDPKKTALAETVHIAGLRTKIYQYQTFGAYWQMLNSRTHGGGFLADSMGLGKTLSFLAYFVVERQLCVLWDEVEKSRKDKDGKHLATDQHAVDDICPSARKSGWISCPCASSSPTSRLLQKPGVRLACVPNELVKSWWGEWKKHIDDKVEPLVLGLNIAINYKGALDFSITTQDMNKCADTGSNINRLKSSGPGGKKATHNSGWLVITSAKDFMPWINKYFTDASPPRTPKKYNIEFGIGMIDESHEEYFKHAGRSKILSDMPGKQPYLWGYSGTPFSQTPRGLEGVLSAIEGRTHGQGKGGSGWASHPNLSQFQWGKLDQICKTFDTQIKSRTPDKSIVDKTLAEFVPFLKNFVIRRDGDTKWFGHSLIRLNPHYHYDLQLDNMVITADNFRSKVGKLESEFQSEEANALVALQEKWDNFPERRRTPNRPEQLAFNTLCRLQWRSRIIATLPYVVSMINSEHEKHKLDLSVAETLEYFRRTNKITDNPYYKHMKSIAESSPKLLYVYQLIQQLKKGVDFQGEEQKLIIMSEFPQVVFITYMFLLKFLPDDIKKRVGVIMPGMKAKERTGVLDAFTDALNDRGKHRQIHNNLILIGTTRLIGKGLQLTRAAHMVLMEPEYEFVNELQAYGRVHRIGQKNPCSYSYRLINSASEIERRIIERQKARKESVGVEVEGMEVKEWTALNRVDSSGTDA